MDETLRFAYTLLFFKVYLVCIFTKPVTQNNIEVISNFFIRSVRITMYEYPCIVSYYHVITWKRICVVIKDLCSQLMRMIELSVWVTDFQPQNAFQNVMQKCALSLGACHWHRCPHFIFIQNTIQNVSTLTNTCICRGGRARTALH